jgi:hypothetical protein
MNRIIVAAAVIALLAACENKSTVRITDNRAAVETETRSEPIFYNGKTYQLDFSFIKGSGAFEMAVSGMTAKQKKDAVAVATSSLGYFACPEGQKGKLQGEPSYVDSRWRMRATCARG